MNNSKSLTAKTSKMVKAITITIVNKNKLTCEIKSMGKSIVIANLSFQLIFHVPLDLPTKCLPTPKLHLLPNFLLFVIHIPAKITTPNLATPSPYLGFAADIVGYYDE